MKKIIIPLLSLIIAAAAVFCALRFQRGADTSAGVLRGVPSGQVKNTPSPFDTGYIFVKAEKTLDMEDSICEYGDLSEDSYITVYSADGGEKKIRPYDLAEYQSVGWMDEMPEREGMAELRDGISSYISGIPGEWGVFVKRMDTNEYLTINESQYSGASLIKLFTMAAVYNEIAAGSMAMSDDIRESLDLMIVESSNLECNRLTAALGGGDTVTGFNVENRNTAALDCQNTSHQSELVDGTGSTTFVGFNRTSPADCAKVLELIYKRKLVSEEASAQMLDMLKRQERTWKIPASLPEGTVTANKTGETDTVEADAAIVYSPACDYVICVIGNGSVGSGVENIQTISRMTYEYLNQ